jgi:hypothetical protein
MRVFFIQPVFAVICPPIILCLADETIAAAMLWLYIYDTGRSTARSIHQLLTSELKIAPCSTHFGFLMILEKSCQNSGEGRFLDLQMGKRLLNMQ